MPLDALEKIYEFKKDCMITRIYYNIDENLNYIGNVDETPCWKEMIIEKTIAKIGEKEIRVKSFNMEQHRFSLVLCILGNGSKLPPMIAFKGKSGAILEKRLQNFVKDKKFNIKIACKEHAWVDKVLF